MFTLGVVFLLLGFLLGVPVLWTLGVILIVVGAVLWLMGAVGREIGGRRHYY
jgi:VIT1/CCC1 family predicted Fe2+/Mn2+ transporter